MTLISAFCTSRYGQGFASRDAIERHQQKRMAFLRRKIMPQSPFYAGFADRPIEEWPVLNKAGLMEHFTAINTRNIPKEKALEIALIAEESRDFSPMLGDVAIGLSTGTSGQRGLFLTDARERALWAGVMLGRFLPSPLLRKQRIAFFLRANNALYEGLNGLLLEFSFYHLLKEFESHIARLQSQSPTVLIAPAQVLCQLAKRQAAGEIYLAPRRIISVAEVLSPEDAAEIEAAFGIRPDQVYQCTEGVLAYSCKAGNLHLNERYVKIERDVIDPESGAFCPIVTDFTHETLPILRYRLDDVLIPSDVPCPCGCASQRIARIEGRVDDILYWATPEGGRRMVLSDMIRQEIALLHVPVHDYRVIQRGMDEIEIALDSSVFEVAAQQLHSRLQSLAARLGATPPAAYFHNGLPAEPQGKRRRVRAAAPQDLSQSGYASWEKDVIRFPNSSPPTLLRRA